MRTVFASGCLGLARLRWDGGSVPVDHPVWSRWQAEGRLFQFCPEVAAGLPIPREPAEISGGTAADVLDGRARVLGRDGSDLTADFLRAAELGLDQIRRHRPALAVLVDRSPSCGSTTVYDGSFTGTRIAGRGLSAELLYREGVPLFTPESLDAAAAVILREDPHSAG
ncbi:DUF523 domain-containing protein [Cellulomonas denverensis]|uniref:DUF523 domain-containing protein n=1 Tax=Cellulomonas denverensis TaxID=264297 RepID=A0A7X6KUR4_9CELL|nr:DUF523 domain-containing protein [Cellulomonas denverensis]NKY22455.1 DUF523 domain-containing protein [Cellulomonas denverensis]GIG25928.1 hypothetical protein Cde04nite_21720 [Cellulomonas denverensis]